MTATVTMASYSVPAMADDPGLNGFVKCLTDFDALAKAKKLSVENYKIALEGQCTSEEEAAKQLNGLELLTGHDEASPRDQYASMLTAKRAKMVANYIMR